MSQKATDNNDELSAMLREMGVDTSQDDAKVKAVEAAPKRSKRSAKKKKQPEPKEEAPAAPAEQKAETPENYHAVFKAEPVFDDEPKHTTNFDFMLNGDHIQVTEDDKKLYIKAILHDVPLELDIRLAGSIVVTCRAITPYERELATNAVIRYYKAENLKDINEMFLMDYVRRYLMAMQITKLNGVPTSYLSFDSHNETRTEHLDTLAFEGKKIADNYNMAKYNLFVKAINIFENKLARLNTAASKLDFWEPGGTD